MKGMRSLLSAFKGRGRSGILSKTTSEAPQAAGLEAGVLAGLALGGAYSLGLVPEGVSLSTGACSSCGLVLEPHAPSGVRRHRSPRYPIHRGLGDVGGGWERVGEDWESVAEGWERLREVSGKFGALRLSLGECLWEDVIGVMSCDGQLP